MVGQANNKSAVLTPPHKNVSGLNQAMPLYDGWPGK